MSVFGPYGVEVILNNQQDFLKIRETLTRIGIVSTSPDKTGDKDKALVQSAHILHKRGHYAIIHFKELFKMDGKDRFIGEDGEVRETSITEDDIARRNKIAFLLQQWGLLKIKDQENIKDNKVPLSEIKVIPHREKKNWTLIAKHSLGKKKRKT